MGSRILYDAAEKNRRCRYHGRLGRTNMTLRRRALLLGAFALSLMGSDAVAQNYPDHPVKIVVPVGPAGSYDLLGRLVADLLSKRTGQSFVVENRPGAGSVVGTKSVVSAAPDGYTLLVGGLS